MLAFLQIFFEYAVLFLEIERKQKKEKKANNFLEAKVQPQGVAYLAFASFFLPMSVSCCL